MILDNKTYLSRKWIFDDKNVFIVCDLEGKINEWIKLFKNALKGHQTLFIIDDCSAEGEMNKKRDALSELAFSGHHRNHSLWVLMQKYNSVSKDVREQINGFAYSLQKIGIALRTVSEKTTLFQTKTKGID